MAEGRMGNSKVQNSEEIRCVNRSVESREGEDSAQPTIEGYAAMFNARTVIQTWYDSFEEFINPRAFDRAIAERQNVRALFNHDSNMLLGAIENDTLKLRADETGLFDTILPNMETTTGRDVFAHIKRGELKGQSFAFTIRSDKWTFGKDKDLDVREILEIETLYDVGPVTYPAYEATSIAARDKDTETLKRTREWRKEFESKNRSTLVELEAREDLEPGAFRVEGRESGLSVVVSRDLIRRESVPEIPRVTSSVNFLRKRLAIASGDYSRK